MRADAPGDPDGAISPLPSDPPTGALLYPLGLRVRGRRAVVVGSGPPAERRVAGLLTAGAQVLVVAPALSPPLEHLAAAGRITARRGDYAAGDLDGAWLVVACAGDPRADAAVAADAERRRIWCAADDDAGALAWTPQIGGTADSAGLGDETGGGAVRFAYSGHRALVLGGARSGKSVTAERLLAAHAHVDYLATGPVPDPGDAEWGARVLLHQRRRPAGWRTVETLDLGRELAAGGAPVLVDCLSTWLAGVMDECGIWAGLPDADPALARRTDALVAAWQATRRRVVAVSNEVGSGVVPATVSGRRFRDELGSLNARIAAQCDEVWLCTAGIARRLR
jgi:adenosylcobinamide kinase / adenosylcobinamide-phosphate guanylyltransferase